MNILVTGCAGMTGSKVCEILTSDSNNDVTGIDNFFNGRYENMKKYIGNKNFHFEKVDVRDYDAVQRIFESRQFDIVLHLAAIVETKNFYDNVVDTYAVNVEASFNLLDLAKICKVPFFAFASTSEAYGHAAELQETLSEDAQCIFDSPEISKRWSYSHGKLMIEHLANAMATDDFKTVCFRYANVYGAADSENSMHIIPYLVRCAIKNEIPKLGHRYDIIKRTFLHNNDSSEATVFLIKKLMKNELKHKLYNIATFEEYTISQVRDLVYDTLGKKPTGVELIDLHRPDEPLRRLLNCHRLYDLGWRPHMTLQTGILETASKYEVSKKC